MRNLVEAIDDEFCRSLSERIRDAAVETIDAMFGYNISINEDTPDLSPHQVAVRVNMSQGIKSMIIRLVFDYDFIMKLVDHCYEQMNRRPEDDEICMDASCELANIICNKIKLYLNENNFMLLMDFPRAERPEETELYNDQNILTLNFSAPEPFNGRSNILSIDANIRGF